MGIFRILTYFIIFYILVTFLASIWLDWKSYEFNVRRVKKIAYDNSGLYFDAGTLHEKLQEAYNNSVISNQESRSLAVSTGGLQGSISLLYGSLSEFLAIYHAPLSTCGNSGRHFMNISVTVLSGQVHVWSERQNKVIDYIPGDQYVHRVGEKSLVEFDRDTYLLLYGRGLIPITMGYWVSDFLFSTHDPVSAISTIYYYLKAVFSSMGIMDFFISVYNYLWMLAYNGISQIPVLLEFIRNWISNFTSYLFGSNQKKLMDN